MPVGFHHAGSDLVLDGSGSLDEDDIAAHSMRYGPRSGAAAFTCLVHGSHLQVRRIRTRLNHAAL